MPDFKQGTRDQNKPKKPQSSNLLVSSEKNGSENLAAVSSLHQNKYRSQVTREQQTLMCSLDCLVETVIVDDEPMNTFVIEQYLDYAKYPKNSYRSFNNSTDALEFIKSRLAQKCCQNLKLLLTDIEMPGLTGFELTQLVRQECRRHSYNQLRIVAQTTLERKEIFAQAAFSGINHILTKPLAATELLPLVDGWLSRNQEA